MAIPTGYLFGVRTLMIRRQADFQTRWLAANLGLMLMLMVCAFVAMAIFAMGLLAMKVN